MAPMKKMISADIVPEMWEPVVSAQVIYHENKLVCGEVEPEGEDHAEAKKMKRILANRRSARQCRLKKLIYIEELEKKVESLQVEISLLSPHIILRENQRQLLNIENRDLNQRMSCLCAEGIIKIDQFKALTGEATRLKQLLFQQKQQKLHQQQFQQRQQSIWGLQPEEHQNFNMDANFFNI